MNTKINSVDERQRRIDEALLAEDERLLRWERSSYPLAGESPAEAVSVAVQANGATHDNPFSKPFSQLAPGELGTWLAVRFDRKGKR